MSRRHRTGDHLLAQGRATRGQVFKGCYGKHGYPSRHVANGMIRMMQTEWAPESSSLLEAYKCRICHRWHIGRNRRRAES